MSNCKTAFFRGAEMGFEIRVVPLPALALGEALVRITYCTLCGSDLHSITGQRPIELPSVLGHEAIGTVEALGKSPPRDLLGSPIQVGDRITWSVIVACEDCDRCRSGLPQKCRKLFKYGHEAATEKGSLYGGLAEFLHLQANSAIVKLSPSTQDSVACPANCATATIAAAMRQAGSLAGRSVLILGAGMLGLTATAMAATYGAKSVGVADIDTSRLQRATHFGASEVFALPSNNESRHPIRDAVGNRQFDVVLEVSGSIAAVTEAIALADVGATIVLIGSVFPGGTIPIDPEQVVRKCLRLIGVHNYAAHDLVSAVEFLESYGEKFPFAKLVEKEFPLQDIDAAVEFARQRRPVRIAVVPS